MAITTTNHTVQTADNILLIAEVKMSVVWNWEYIAEKEKLKYIGDYTTHQGNPSFLRSDTMLKAIGKSINIRVSGPKSTKIPIVIIGNTPITKTYWNKVDYLKKFGIVQGFYSVNPSLVEGRNIEDIGRTPGRGFLTINHRNARYLLMEGCLAPIFNK